MSHENVLTFGDALSAFSEAGEWRNAADPQCPISALTFGELLAIMIALQGYDGFSDAVGNAIDVIRDAWLDDADNAMSIIQDESEVLRTILAGMVAQVALERDNATVQLALIEETLATLPQDRFPASDPVVAVTELVNHWLLDPGNGGE